MNFNFNVGDEVFYSKKEDIKSFSVYKVKIDKLLICALDDEHECPKCYEIEILSSKSAWGKELLRAELVEKYTFASDEELFETQQEAVIYSIEKINKIFDDEDDENKS